METDGQVVNAIEDLAFDRSPLGVISRVIRTKMLYDFTEDSCNSNCGPVRFSYNPFFPAFSRNSVFLL